MAYKILINFATRSRPEKAASAVDNIRKMAYKCPEILLKIDTDDNSDYSALTGCTILRGDSKNKVDAINRGDLLQYEWDILLNHSDDMEIVMPNFDLVIARDMQSLFPDFDGVLHYPDGHTGSDLMSYSIIGRKYYERDNFIYHPDFVSLWCDNWAQDVAKIRGKYAYIDVQLFRHNHPVWTGEPQDAQYQHTQSFYHSDRITYLRHKENNYYL